MIYDLQKAGLLKRFSAFLLDFILICVLAAGFAYLLSLATGIDGYSKTLHNYYEEYGEKYNVDFNISAEDYEKLPDSEKDRYNEVYGKIFKEHPDAYKAYNMTMMLPILITTFGLLLSFLVFEFVIPVCLKNGQTVGKKVFSLGVVFVNSVKITNFALLVRAILGKFTIETMVPVAILFMIFFYNLMGIVGFIVLGLLLILQIVLLIATKTNSFIHDILANTAVVDMQSQMIFATQAELIAYKEDLHEQEVKNNEQ